MLKKIDFLKLEHETTSLSKFTNNILEQLELSLGNFYRNEV